MGSAEDRRRDASCVSLVFVTPQRLFRYCTALPSSAFGCVFELAGVAQWSVELSWRVTCFTEEYDQPFSRSIWCPDSPTARHRPNSSASSLDLTGPPGSVKYHRMSKTLLRKSRVSCPQVSTAVVKHEYDERCTADNGVGRIAVSHSFPMEKARKSPLTKHRTGKCGDSPHG